MEPIRQSGFVQVKSRAVKSHVVIATHVALDVDIDLLVAAVAHQRVVHVIITFPDVFLTTSTLPYHPSKF
jgi:hypothetical protein